jgi:hypothetical protein
MVRSTPLNPSASLDSVNTTPIDTPLHYTYYITTTLAQYNRSAWLLAVDWTQTNVACFRRVLPSRVNALGYLRVQQTTTISQHPSVEAEISSHTPRKINRL